jgi:hypothetical protein
MLTVAELRHACTTDRWPLPGKENTGKLCTGCLGDVLYCQERFETRVHDARDARS